MISVAFHPEAEAEFIEAARYYEAQAENLGLDFISAVERTYQRLATFPESGHPFGSRLRRVLAPGSRTVLCTALRRIASSSSPLLTYAAGPATGAPELERGAAQQGAAADRRLRFLIDQR